MGNPWEPTSLVGRGRIKAGASVLMDFGFWRWPDLPNGEVGTVFDFRSIGDGERLDAKAPRFGERDDYGNGSLYVKPSDVEWIGIPDHVFAGEAI